MPPTLGKYDCVGLVRPALDAHSLGVSALGQLLADCGIPACIAGTEVCTVFGAPEHPAHGAAIEYWLRQNHITVLGFSYRLDPEQGAASFARLVHVLKGRRMLNAQGGPLKALYFAGLPQACQRVRQRVPETTGVFQGDETPAETLRILGVDPGLLPAAVSKGVGYDTDRLAFGHDLIQRGEYRQVQPVDRRGTPGLGTRAETLMARVNHGRAHQLPPLMRAHVGPYLPNRQEAVNEFLRWTQQLAQSGLLDVLSIGCSQLTQSDFGQDWGTRPNGGGVPLNSAAEFHAVWEAARPMLVRAYAGTRNIPQMAQLHEQTIAIAWHALSLWWFCQTDGRGPYPLAENLQQHIDTLKVIATAGKPFEPNIPHHFAFRGADDVTYVVSAVLAAKLAKTLGIRHLVLQTMLNTPKYTWGIQDLAKARATLQLVRELEGPNFSTILQPRGGLDYFSPDLARAKAQLAAVTALMDDIEPDDATSPQVIHVVSYSEAAELASPEIVLESIQITRQALVTYRKLRAKGHIDHMGHHPEVLARTQELLTEARTVLQAIETHVPNPYSAQGFYQIFAQGYLPVPYLWGCRDDFSAAVRWPTRLIRGGVKVVDEMGQPMTAATRMAQILQQRT